MQELAVADVDADVVHAAAVDAEEDDVAGAERGAVDALAGVGHVAGDARQLDAERGLEHVADQAAAVETVGAGAAPAVGRAKQGQRA